MSRRSEYIIIEPGDSVAVALRPYAKGETITINGAPLTVQEDIPAGHKIALKDLVKDEAVIKYGNKIGVVTKDIKQGQWVHTHNVKSHIHGNNEYTYNPRKGQEAVLPVPEGLSFQGYKREDGLTGTRNYVFIIPTVNCSNGPITCLTEMANAKYPKTENFDGFLPLFHPFGCSQTGKDLEYTQKILAGLAQNPNAGGVLIVSLGCEINSLDVFKPYLGDINEKRIKFLILQDHEDEFTAGMELCDELYQYTASFKREPLPLSELVIGVNCGGSDGFSGLTANPLVGEITNIITAQNGTVVMTEVPEMFGAEHILMDRAKDEETFRKIVKLINDYKGYFHRYGEEAAENPTQGNNAGGLTTLEEKSLGCIKKGGEAPVTDVLAYGERVKTRGFNLLSGPGNDLVGVTAQIAAGCNLIIFTTGRGTPAGFVVPTIRVASNSTLAQKKKNWIDFDAGALLHGVDKEVLTRELLALVIDVASGVVRTKTEQYNYFEIGILRDGVTL
jgi:altronate hydrolase